MTLPDISGPNIESPCSPIDATKARIDAAEAELLRRRYAETVSQMGSAGPYPLQDTVDVCRGVDAAQGPIDSRQSAADLLRMLAKDLRYKSNRFEKLADELDRGLSREADSTLWDIVSELQRKLL